MGANNCRIYGTANTPSETANAISPRTGNLSFSCTSLTASIKDNRNKRAKRVYTSCISRVLSHKKKAFCLIADGTQSHTHTHTIQRAITFASKFQYITLSLDNIFRELKLLQLANRDIISHILLLTSFYNYQIIITHLAHNYYTFSAQCAQLIYRMNWTRVMNFRCDMCNSYAIRGHIGMHKKFTLIRFNFNQSLINHTEPRCTRQIV